jgi:integrase/recombinase XerD
MATINFEIEKKENQKANIFLRFRHQNNQFKYYPGFKIEITAWNAKKQRLKGTAKEVLEINDRLDYIEQVLQEIIREARINTQDKNLSFAEIKEKFDLKFKKEKDTPTPDEVKLNPTQLQDLFEFFIKEKENEFAKGTLVVYKRIIKNLNRFSDLKKIALELPQINKQFYLAYKDFLIQKMEYLNSTATVEIKKIKRILTYYQDEFAQISNDFKKFKGFSEDKTQTEKHTCSETEIKELYSFKFEGQYKFFDKVTQTEVIINAPVLEKVRDVFVFAFYTGLAYKELETLDISNVKKIEFEQQTYRIISFHRGKTKKQIIVPLNSTAIEIMERYQGKQKRLLPVFTNQRNNFYLHIVLKESGLFNDLVQTIRYSGNQKIEKVIPRYEAITMHSARHSFATHLVNSKFPLPFIQMLLGHSSIKTTEIYAKMNPMEVVKSTLEVLK